MKISILILKLYFKFIKLHQFYLYCYHYFFLFDFKFFIKLNCNFIFKVKFVIIKQFFEINFYFQKLFLNFIHFLLKLVINIIYFQNFFCKTTAKQQLLNLLQLSVTELNHLFEKIGLTSYFVICTTFMCQCRYFFS